MIKSFKSFTEERTNGVVVTFGRYNPPTVGHEKLFDAVAKIAKGKNFLIYSSQSNDLKNPLEYDDKIKFLRKMFPSYGRSIISDKGVKNVFDVAVKAYDAGYTKLTLVVGSDRIDEFTKLLNKYDGVKAGHGYYSFRDGIEVKSAGERDPDSDGVSGMSASKMRAAAADNNLEAFAKGVPKTFGDVKDLFNAVRVGLGLKESYNFRKHVQFVAVSENRERYIAGEIFNKGDVVYSTKTADAELMVLEQKPNYVVCKNLHTLAESKIFVADLRLTLENIQPLCTA
jgi:hypothetical protein